MAYATVCDLISRFGERELIQLTDRQEPPVDQVDETVAQPALDTASSIIDGYVGAKYALPLNAYPALLTDIACDIARFRLFSDQAPEAVIKRNDQAVSMLRAISKGEIKIDVGSIEPPPRPDVIEVSGPRRRFTSETLRRM
jgi:phage gp36-like protein